MTLLIAVAAIFLFFNIRREFRGNMNQKRKKIQKEILYCVFLQFVPIVSSRLGMWDKKDRITKNERGVG